MINKILEKNEITEKQAWNTILNMVGNADDFQRVQDIGQKGKGKDKFHEFMIGDFTFKITKA